MMEKNVYPFCREFPVLLTKLLYQGLLHIIAQHEQRSKNCTVISLCCTQDIQAPRTAWNSVGPELCGHMGMGTVVQQDDAAREFIQTYVLDLGMQLLKCLRVKVVLIVLLSE
jgi:hypothetical protein